MPKPSKGEKLTAKQKMFVAHYLMCWNATEAARRAGYSAKTTHAIGWENLRKPEIKSAIDARMAEYVMSANEVLTRLSQMASGNLVDVLNLDDEFDFELARETGMTHLIRKLKRRQYTDKDGNTTRETEVELYSAQDALIQLAKYHGLFVQRIELKDWREQARKDGYDPEELFARLVNAALVRESGSRSDSDGADPTDNSG